MKVFLIIIAIIALLIIFICSLSATFTIVYDKGWHTKIKILFIEKDIELSKLLSFIIAPGKKADDVNKNKKSSSLKKQTKSNENTPEHADNTSNVQNQNQKPKKSNPIAKLWNDEGILGILSLASNLIETANKAVITLFKGLHIYSFYVMIIVGGWDAAQIAKTYGHICSVYYPIKGVILNGMRVDNYDDCIQADYIAPTTEFEFQFIGSISVGLLLKVLIKAGFVFIKNITKNSKGDI